MSHSVTTTASYVLNKYSRSYPSTSLQVAQPPVESEWQHFTNPVMSIILEVKKSPSGQLASMRLRILWSLHTGANDLHIDQREVVFEDLELLSFSSLSTVRGSASLHSDQSLPLKAVYRDAVVGIRYLHPRIFPPDSQPTYRRFQVTFKVALDASQFIDAIRSVCPCKANPQPTHINRHSTMLAPPLTRAETTVSNPMPAQLGIMSTSIDRRPTLSTVFGQLPENQAFSIAPSSASTSLSSDDNTFVTCSETSYRADAQVDGYRKDVNLPKRRGRDLAQSSLPNSSQPSSSDQSIAMPPPPVPQRATGPDVMTQPSVVNAGDERSRFLASLSEHPSLYELSRTELETLVGRVIREEGFVHLVHENASWRFPQLTNFILQFESLDSMWRVKGFLGH